MKFFILCLAVAAISAEPQYFYNSAMPYTTLPYTMPYSMPYAMPAVYAAKVKTYSNDNTVSSPNYAGKGTYYAESAGAIHMAKREAEPQYFYNSAMPYTSMPYTMPYAMPYAMPAMYAPKVKTYSNDNTASSPAYAGKGTYYAESAGAIHMAKREAEPQYFYNSALPYTTMPYTSMPYTMPYAMPAVYAAQMKTYANDNTVSSPAYAGKGTYYAESAGAIHQA